MPTVEEAAEALLLSLLLFPFACCVTVAVAVIVSCLIVPVAAEDNCVLVAASQSDKVHQ